MDATTIALILVAAVSSTFAVLAVRRIATWRTRVLRAAARVDGRGDRDGRDDRTPFESGVDQLERAASAAREQAADFAGQRDLLAGALAVHGDGVVVVDPHGTVVLRNDAGAQYLDARYAEAAAEDSIRRLLERARLGHAGERELPLFGPPRRVLQIWAHPLVIDGVAAGAVAFVRDVTETKRVESIRRDFVANVSHELKTPIGALALLAETMAVGSDPLVMAQLADRLVHEAERVTRMVDDLLDLSTIEAQEAPTRDPVPVHALLSEAHELVRPAAHAVAVPIHIGPLASDLVVRCDQRQLVSALRNLLDNAVKYSEAGDVVELSAALVGDRVCISVRDHGVGIPARDLERIFERFYRVDKARSRDTGGTGLGLSIVRHIVQAHGGEVTVDSVEGEGSVFRLRFPDASAGTRSFSEAS